ncbi:hypothetical protein HK097_000795, partial [Rhizophlyctis rosea]
GGVDLRSLAASSVGGAGGGDVIRSALDAISGSGTSVRTAGGLGGASFGGGGTLKVGGGLAGLSLSSLSSSASPAAFPISTPIASSATHIAPTRRDERGPMISLGSLTSSSAPTIVQRAPEKKSLVAEFLDWDDGEGHRNGDKGKDTKLIFAPTFFAGGDQRGGGEEGVKVFGFDSPSPDDRVQEARKGVSVGKSHKIPQQPPSTPTQQAKSTPAPSKGVSQLRQDLEGMNLEVSKAQSTPKTSPAASATKPATPQHNNELLKPVPMSRSGSSAGSRSGNKSSKGKLNLEEEYKKRESSGKGGAVGVVVVGHVDAGKSTLMGHLLYLLGHVTSRQIDKFQRDASKIGKASFAFAWVLDEGGEERERGVTIDVAQRYFETGKKRFVLLDAPGHRDFVPRMVGGASQADAAVLVIDSTAGEFETGFELGGQTREHAVLVRALGVGQVLVAVNKLDVTKWSEERYNEIVGKMRGFLQGAGFRKENVEFVPVSGFTGENVLERKDPVLSKWYSGRTLVECLDAFTPPTRPLTTPFRLSVSDVFKPLFQSTSGASSSISVSGRIESGGVQVGDTVLVMPVGEKATVRSVEIAEEAVGWGVAGDSVVVGLAGVEGASLRWVFEEVLILIGKGKGFTDFFWMGSVGNVLCDPAKPVAVTSHFRAQIITFDILVPLTIGVPVVLHHQSLTEPGTISKMVSILNKGTGEVVKKSPRALPRNTTAIVEIKTQRPICLEVFKEFKELGRVMLRVGSTSVAAGVVLEILSFERSGGGVL